MRSEEQYKNGDDPMEICYCSQCREVFEVWFYDPVEDRECMDFRCPGELCLVTAQA